MVALIFTCGDVANMRVATRGHRSVLATSVNIAFISVESTSKLAGS